MSAKAELFKAIQTRLLTKLSFAPQVPLPPIQWIDRNKGQIENWRNFASIPLPAILISFPDTSWTNYNRNVQEGQIRIKIVIIYECVGEFFQGAPEIDESLKCYEFEEQVYAALQGFRSTDFEPLQRVSSTDDEDHDMAITFGQEYLTMIKDTGAQTAKDYVLVDPDLNVVYKKELLNAPPSLVIKSRFVVPKKT